MEPTDRERLAGLMEEAAGHLDAVAHRHECVRCVSLASRLRAEAKRLRGPGEPNACGHEPFVQHAIKAHSLPDICCPDTLSDFNEPATGAACGACGSAGWDGGLPGKVCAACHGTGRAALEAGR